jgi:hypothetical protein
MYPSSLAYPYKIHCLPLSFAFSCTIWYARHATVVTYDLHPTGVGYKIGSPLAYLHYAGVAAVPSAFDQIIQRNAVN